ncbi:MAG: nitroreductase family protein [Porticoccaceae bacterium]|nr:nitroreductase family protein [Porticoccaceae bacterium]
MKKHTNKASESVALMAQRRSYPRLQEPAPSGQVLESILAAALRSPDHMHLRPWRFLSISGDDRKHLGDLFVNDIVAKQEDASAEICAQAHNKAFRAPLIIVGVAAYRDHPKVPKIEQAVSAGGVLNNMGLAAYLLGFGAVWRTGPYAYSDTIKAGLGIDEEEDIIGYLYLGTPPTWDRKITPVPIDDYVATWP